METNLVESEKRQWQLINTTTEMGRSRYEIMCPWCGYTFTAFLWSLAGSGKRCPYCKSLHKWLDMMAHEPPAPKQKRQKRKQEYVGTVVWKGWKVDLYDGDED